MTHTQFGVHAAVEENEKRNREEEDMARYTHEELNGDWEFKILRSVTGAFKRSETLAAALDYEALGGWELLEKFDNGRVRLKRPASARAKDASRPSDYDPYRTQHGISEGGLASLIIIGILAVAAIGFGIAYFFNFPL